MRVPIKTAAVLGIFLFGIASYLWQDTKIAGAKMVVLTAPGGVYLPFVQSEIGHLQTPVPTATPLPTATAAPVDTGDVRITAIFFDGEVFQFESDEYVEIKNFDTKPINLNGWRLHDEDEIHKFTFPAYTIQPGEICRIYTNEDHPDWCGLNWGNNKAIWHNDNGDEVTLIDSQGQIIDTCPYPAGGGPLADCQRK